ncbi:hypothetical protein KA078_02495 [Candidatus Woesebacteria bacterium]|nr:hypothetical protein [Candidatus Woesebacteria bacterium]
MIESREEESSMTTDPDKITNDQTIYGASYSEIFWRNFVAGAARALGSLLFQILFIVVLANFFVTYAWPHLAPLMQSLTSVSKTLQNLQWK